MIPNELKVVLQEDHTRLDKLLIVLFFHASPQTVKDIKDTCRSLGFRVPQKWNISSILSGSKTLAVRVDNGWEITDKGVEYLHKAKLIPSKNNPSEKSNELRTFLVDIKNEQTRSFLDEAITCIEHGLYRASIIMIWSAAMHVLQNHVVETHLDSFNAEARKVNQRWSDAKSIDDLGLMKEREFLDRLQNISLIGKDVKTQLIECLVLRNSCSHPNSLKIDRLKVSSHIEILILNVFQRYL